MITRYLSVTIELRSAAIFTVEGGDPNDAQTLDYVPGAAIRGALAGTIVAAGGNQSEMDEYVLDGAVRCLNAYPIGHAGGRRALPIPASWRVRKGENADYALDAGADWRDSQLSGYPARFCTWEAADVRRVEVARTGRVHQQRDRERGRAWTERRDNGDEIPHGTIYAYESIDAGQTFRGLIAIDADDEGQVAERAGRVRTLLSGTIRIGRSKRSEYGEAEVRIDDGPAHEVAAGIDGVAAGEVLRAVLLSDHVGRHPGTGQLDPAAFETELMQALAGPMEVEQSFVEPIAIGGYNRHWGVPLPLALGARAGSMMVLRASADIGGDELRAIEHAGLGERRAEGFGRVAFLAASPPSTAVGEPIATGVPAPLADAVPAVVGFIQERMLRRELDRRIANHAAFLVRDDPPKAIGSVLARLRGQLRGTEPKEGLEILRRWLMPDGKEELRESARNHLDRCRVGGRRLSSWMRAILDDDAAARVVLTSTEPQPWLISEEAAADHVAAEGDRLRARLIDEVLRAIAIKARAGGKSADAEVEDAA